MFLTHCGMTRVVLAVLSLCWPVRSAVEVIQPYRVVSTDGKAQVRCLVQPRPSNHQLQPPSDRTPPYPYPDPEELRVTLLKGLYGAEEFCSSTISVTGQRGPGVEAEGGVQCSAQVREGAVEVTVSGLKAAHTDLYRCDIEIFFPPPYLRLTGNGTLVHVSGSADCPVPEARRQTAHGGDDEEEEEEEEGDERMAPVSVPVVALVVLVTFVLILIIYLQALQCKRGRREVVRPAPAGPLEGDAAVFSCTNYV